MTGNKTTLTAHVAQSTFVRPYGKFSVNHYFNQKGQPVWQKNPVRAVQKNAQNTKNRVSNNEVDPYDKMLSDIKKEPNWFKKAGIYFRYCRDFHDENPGAWELANRVAGV